ncbi:MAG: rhodanese-like domain-containing protein [Actinomycetota bacterium]|nr:rhodanese-like domain-containing protein [Actinomycetota bacterium]
MPRDVELDRLRQLVESTSLQLIEVLPETEYAEEHIAGAINIPLKSMNRDTVAELDPSLPTVVYCWDDI